MKSQYRPPLLGGEFVAAIALCVVLVLCLVVLPLVLQAGLPGTDFALGK